MPLEKRFLEALTAFGKVMRAQGGRWYLFGAQAVLFWGWSRFTEDLDVTAEVDIDQPQRFVEAMQAEGFQLRTEDWQQFLRATRVLPFHHPPTQTVLDVVAAGPGMEETFLERAVEIEIEGRVLSVIRAEDLVTGKIIAGRPKDLEDVYGILRQRGETLDLDMIRKDLQWMDTFLGHDLLAKFERQLDRARSAES